MYSDEIKKIEFYKQRIIDRYLQEGTIIDKNKLQQYIDAIDLKIALFKQAYIANGENLDLKKFNEQKAYIYEDLKILYEILYMIAQEKVTDAEAKIKCTLNELQLLAKKYQYRTKLETLSIYGDTIFYKTNGFQQYYDNGSVYISLGPLNISSGSYLACLMSCDECKNSDIIFRFDDSTQVSEYTYNKDYLKILGNYKINTYKVTTEEDYNQAFKINLESEINSSSKYTVLAGEDKIKTIVSNEIQYINKSSGMPIFIEKDCEISFYVYGASSIEFNINENYSYKSFDNYNIEAPKRCQKILIKAHKNFILDFVTDGTVFADRSSCSIVENTLYSDQKFPNISDFMVEEIAVGEDVVFNDVMVIVKKANSTFLDINYIAIKQTQIMELDENM